MTILRLSLAVALGFGLLLAAPSAAPQRAPAGSADLVADLDDIFADPAIVRALVGIRVESLTTGAVIYERSGGKLVVPASNMKLVTMAVAAERLGWDYRFETKLEHNGRIDDGTLNGDLIVTGSGDPSIVGQDLGPSAVFNEWADALLKAGIRRVDGRIIGDDNAFDDEGVGAGWEWEDLTAGYGAPSGALSYNENVVRVAVTPGRSAGDRTRIDLVPPANIFEIQNEVVTALPGTTPRLEVIRLPFTTRLVVRGAVASLGNSQFRTMAVDNPTRFFVEGLRAALASAGHQRQGRRVGHR